ncbi:MAG: hypothetical protein VX568_01875, partial [Actinomycetota bacterium]|nr:hypothetical protein [Actinomycetota bacterium]
TITSRDVYFDEEFRLVEKQKDSKQWLFKLDKETTGAELSFACSDDIESAYDLHMLEAGASVGAAFATSVGSVGDDETASLPVIANERTTPTRGHLSSFNGKKLCAQDVKTLEKLNPPLRVVGKKKPGTNAGNRFAVYKNATDVQSYRHLGGTREDLKHDIEKGLVVISEMTGRPAGRDASDSPAVAHKAEPAGANKTRRAIVARMIDDDGQVWDVYGDVDADSPLPTADDEPETSSDDEPEPTAHKNRNDDDEMPGLTDPDDADSDDKPDLPRRSSRPAAPRVHFEPATPADTPPVRVLRDHLVVDFDKMDAHFHEVTHGSDSIRMKDWKNAYQAEMDGVVDSGSLSVPMKLPPGKKAIKSRVIGKEKDDGRLKWRMVPKGYMQKPGVDFDE